MTDFRKEQLSRTALLLGDSAMERLSKARVAVFGIGGVGGYVAEALARSGIGALDLIDGIGFQPEPADYCSAKHGRPPQNRSHGRADSGH